MSRAYVGVTFLLLGLFTASGCQRDLPTGPQREAAPVGTDPLNAFPPNGGMLPEVISTIDGEVQTDSLSFENSFVGYNDEVDGSPWGVWFGDQHILSEDPPTGNVSWTYQCCGHSGSNAVDQRNTPRQAFLFFDPPVRTVSFWYSSNPGAGDGMGGTSFYYRASDSLGSTIQFDSIYANSVYPDDIQYTRVSISSGDEDRIYEIYFDGLMHIDDLVIKRGIEPLDITCLIVVRGDETTCSVEGQVDSVQNWLFSSVDYQGNGLAVIDDTSQTTQWMGRAVLGGTVQASVFQGGDTIPRPAIGQLAVIDRPLWRWSQLEPDSSEVSYKEDFGTPCGETSQLLTDYPHRPYSFVLGANFTLPCQQYGNSILIPNPGSGEGFALDTVSTGPNANLVFVSDASYRISRASRMNSHLRPGTLHRDTLRKNSDKNLCNSAVPAPSDPQVVNWWEFNAVCRGDTTTVDAYTAAIWLHEGVGSKGLQAAEPNGHWGRIRKAATTTIGDPFYIIEGWVAQDAATLGTGVIGGAGAAEAVLQEAVDNSHQYVGDNWCGEIYFFDIGNNPNNTKDDHYARVRMPQDMPCP